MNTARPLSATVCRRSTRTFVMRCRRHNKIADERTRERQRRDNRKKSTCVISSLHKQGEYCRLHSVSSDHKIITIRTRMVKWMRVQDACKRQMRWEILTNTGSEASDNQINKRTINSVVIELCVRVPRRAHRHRNNERLTEMRECVREMMADNYLLKYL